MVEPFAQGGAHKQGPAAPSPWDVPGRLGGYGRWPEPPVEARHARDEPPGAPGEVTGALHAPAAVPVPVPAAAPGPVPVHTGQVRPDGYREFARRMLALHQVLPHTMGQMPMCSCGSVARICPVVNSAHELLGHPVPWEHRADGTFGRPFDG
jgi:hypothetical protein